MQDRTRLIENRLAKIRTARAYLKDAENDLRAVLFDQVPAMRIDKTQESISLSVEAALKALEGA